MKVCPACNEEVTQETCPVCGAKPRHINFGDWQPSCESCKTFRSQLAAAQLWRKKVEGLLKTRPNSIRFVPEINNDWPQCKECLQYPLNYPDDSIKHLDSCWEGKVQAFLTPPTPKPGPEGKLDKEE